MRHFESLLRWLPPDAALWRSSRSSWSEERELAAVQIEVIDSLRRAFIMAHSKQGTRPPEPIRIPRPWEKQETKRKRGTPLKDLIREMRIPVRAPEKLEGGEQNGA